MLSLAYLTLAHALIDTKETTVKHLFLFAMKTRAKTEVIVPT